MMTETIDTSSRDGQPVMTGSVYPVSFVSPGGRRMSARLKEYTAWCSRMTASGYLAHWNSKGRRAGWAARPVGRLMDLLTKFRNWIKSREYHKRMIFSAAPCDMCGTYDTLIEFSYPPDYCPIYLCHKCAAEQGQEQWNN